MEREKGMYVINMPHRFRGPPGAKERVELAASGRYKSRNEY
jgi:hypothetical protein